MTRAKTIACVTMAYNEADMLPLWLAHYARQVGPANCYVLDHGSDDGSTEDLNGAHRVRLARSPLDEVRRAAFVGQICNGLLQQYDYVAFTDTDELLVADPALWPTLLDYINDPHPPVTTAFGLNLLHRINHEPAHNPACPILAQRSWVFPTASMCKPLLIRTPVAWTGGFHNSTAPVAFDRLFLFHLAFFDCETTLRRQQKRRAQSFIDDRTAPHHRLNDETIRNWMEGWSGMLQDQSIALTDSCPATADFTADVLKSASRDAHGMYHIDLNLHRSSLWRIPDRFSGSF